MAQGPDTVRDLVERRWRLIVLIVWLAACAYLLFDR